MDLATLRRILPIAFGVITAILWATVKGPVAMTFSVVGGILLGAFYAFGIGATCEDDETVPPTAPPAA